MDQNNHCPPSGADTSSRPALGPWAIFLIFLRLGLTSFGGPVAHLGYFREEFVVRRQWLSERDYADLVALCQFLPGPASSQVGLAIGHARGGHAGALAAWAGFTLPSAILLILLALGISQHGDLMPPGLLHGLKVVAVAVVAQAVWGMARSLCPDGPRISLMVLTACLVLLWPSAWGQVACLLGAALVGVCCFRRVRSSEEAGGRPPATDRPVPLTLRQGIGLRAGLGWLALFALLLIGLPGLAALMTSPVLAMVDAFYRAGSLVFGGGHVVLPLLQAEVVSTGWVSHDAFLAGYGAAQAVPGPLFTFAAFLGASMNGAPSGWSGGLIALVAIFAPSFLLVFGVLPFWDRLRANLRVQAALTGVNAAVVGLLLAAFYQPVWSGAIHAPQDFALALVALVALMIWKLPPWLVVLASGLAGWGLNLMA